MICKECKKTGQKHYFKDKDRKYPNLVCASCENKARSERRRKRVRDGECGITQKEARVEQDN